ncbi:MAG: hypothetical protein ABIU63_08375 [Chitinophagaceae bacterium]
MNCRYGKHNRRRESDAAGWADADDFYLMNAIKCLRVWQNVMKASAPGCEVDASKEIDFVEEIFIEGPSLTGVRVTISYTNKFFETEIMLIADERMVVAI